MNRQKFRLNKDFCFWWLRSAFSGDDDGVGCVYNYDNVNLINFDYGHGVAPVCII